MASPPMGEGRLDPPFGLFDGCAGWRMRRRLRHEIAKLPLGPSLGSTSHARLAGPVDRDCRSGLRATAASRRAPPRPVAPAPTPPTTNVRSIQMTLLCLHNLERRAHGLSQLRWNRDLTGVASKYARTMVSRRHFAHYSAATATTWTGSPPATTSPQRAAGPPARTSSPRSRPRPPGSCSRPGSAAAHTAATSSTQAGTTSALGVVTTSPGGRSHGLTVVALFGIRTHHPCS